MKNKTFIHPSSFVDENVFLGKNVYIWHFCHIRKNAKIMNNVSLGKNVYIDTDVIVDEGSRIQNNVNVYKGVSVGKWVFIGPNVTFTNDKNPRAGSLNWKVLKTQLGDGCSIGAGSIVLCDVKVGAFSMIGASSVLTQDLPDFHLAYGSPARIISKICACGITKISLKTKTRDLILPCCLKNLNKKVLIIAKKFLGKNEKYN